MENPEAINYEFACLETRSLFHLACLEADSKSHRLNMELDLQSLFELHVYSCIPWLRPRLPRIWAHLGSWALLVSQDRRRLFVNP